MTTTPEPDEIGTNTLVLRVTGPADGTSGVELVRRCTPGGAGGWDTAAQRRVFMLVDIAAEDPRRSLAAALVVADPERGQQIAGFAVEPAWRRRGLAARLLAEVRRAVDADGQALTVTLRSMRH